VAVELDPVIDYPLGSRRPELVTTPSGLGLDLVTLPAARDGMLTPADTRATSATLALQADVARAAGRVQLADGLSRASELADVPDEELLAIYTALRPGRSSGDELEAWAVRLEELAAVQTAAFVREAASVYLARGLLIDG
jgi:propanediol dehydratase small subunit